MYKRNYFSLCSLLAVFCFGGLSAQPQPDEVTSAPTNTASITLCKGAKALLFARGVVSSTWSVGSNDPYIVVMPSAQTNYTVIGKDPAGNLSQTVTTVKIALASPPYVTVTSSAGGTICAGESFSLTAANGTDYTWYNTVTTTTWNTDQITVSPTVSTVYWVSGAHPVNSCVSMDFFRVTVNPCTGLPDHAKKDLSIYPNPASGMFTLLAESDKEVRVLSQRGELVGTYKLNAGNDHKINIQGLANGLYFIVGSAGNSTFSEKLVVSGN